MQAKGLEAAGSETARPRKRFGATKMVEMKLAHASSSCLFCCGLSVVPSLREEQGTANEESSRLAVTERKRKGEGLRPGTTDVVSVDHRAPLDDDVPEPRFSSFSR